MTSTALTRMMPSSSGVSRAATASCASRPRPGMAEHALDDDAAAEHGGRLQAEHGDQRQQRVARDMAQHDAAARQARGAWRRARNPCRQTSAMPARIMRRIERQIDEAERGDRQHQMAGDVERRGQGRSCPRRWSRCRPSGSQRSCTAEDDGQHQAEPEAGHGIERQRADRQQAVAQAAGPRAGDDAERRAEAEGERGGAAHQQQRVGQALEDDVEDRPARR